MYCSVSVCCSVCCSVLPRECLPSLSTLRIVSRSFKAAAVRRIQICACENVSTYVHVQMSCCSACCSVLQCAAVCCSASNPDLCMYHIHSHCNTLQHTATHCNTLQHTLQHTLTLHRSVHVPQVRMNVVHLCSVDVCCSVCCSVLQCE